MIAIGLTLALFGFWFLIGLALLAALGIRRNLLQNLLLAPVIGITAAVLPAFTLNRLNLPVAQFATGLTIVMVLVTAAGLWWGHRQLTPRRYVVGLRAYLPFAAVLLLGLYLTGRPMIEFGLNWVSFANGDMANYVLDAQRLANAGWLAIPDLDLMTQGLDYSQYFWFLAVEGQRPGSQLLLAWLSSVSGLPGHSAYMPLIVALHLTMISGTGALVLQSRRERRAALLTCLLISLSALATVGVLHQLIAQVAGLAALAATATLLLRPVDRALPTRIAVRHGVLTGIVGAGFLVFYPEAVPFLGIATILFLGYQVAIHRSGRVSQPLLVKTGVVAVVGLVLTNTYLITSIEFLIRQFFHATRENIHDASQLTFPFYLIPTGLANLWGLQVLSRIPTEPLSSITIACGAVLLVVAVVTSVQTTRRGHPVGMIALGMFLLSIQLFTQRNDFGLYKLAMFIQPFMLGALVVGWLQLVPRLRYQIVPLLLVGLAGMPAQHLYVEGSRGMDLTFAALRDASSSRITDEFANAVQYVSSNRGSHILIDTPNIVLAKFQSVYSQGMRTQFASKNFFDNLTSAPVSALAGQQVARSAVELDAAIHAQKITARFPWILEGDPAPEEARFLEGDPNAFDINTVGQVGPGLDTCDYLIGTTSRQNIMNRWREDDRPGVNFFAQPCRQIQDYLMFVESALGRHHYNPSVRAELIAISQIERDILWQGRTFVGLGRRMLMQVLNPSDRPRLAMEVTVTIKGDGKNVLPPAVVIADGRHPFPLVGRGSARVFSDPLDPLTVADRRFIGLDMGVPGERFSVPRKGLMLGYGTDIELDPRLLTAFVRDISLVSESDYASMTPPTMLENIEADLQNRNLEYSGLYEDGWISDAAFVGLVQQDASSWVVAKGVVPQVGDPDFTTELQLLVNGREVARQQLRTGDFELRGVSPVGVGRHRVELRFSHLQRLLGEDRRPVAASMYRIGFEPRSTQAGPARITRSAAELANVALTGSGLYPDGWLGEHAFVGLTRPSGPADVVVRGQVPQLDNPGFSTDLTVLVDGREIARKTLGPGDFELRAPAPPEAGERRLELQFSAVQTLPAPDARRVGALMQSVGFEAPGGTAAPAPAGNPTAAQAPTEPGPPQAISDPHTDLGNPALAATGLDGDGWLAGSSTFTLAQPAASTSLLVRGMVPMVADSAYTAQLRVLVDGQEAARQDVGLGEFELRAPVSAGGAQRRIELRFSTTQQLPAPDSRQVGARLQYVGFESAPAAAMAAQAATPATAPSGPVPPRAVTDPHTDLGNPALQATGLDGDGWLAGTSAFTLAQSAESQTIVVRSMVPMVADSAYTAELRVLVDGQEAGRRTVGIGEFELQAPIPAGATQRRIELRFSTTQQLPAPDSRQVGARLQYVGFESTPAAVAAQAATPAPAPSGPMPPRAVTDPHTDLGNPALAPTGLDGDGWVAGTSGFTLNQPAAGAWLVVRGMIPLVNDAAFASELRVMVDGQEVNRATFGPGEFTVRTTIPAGATAQRRVELRFSATQQLPAPDTRQVGARIQGVGFEGN